MEKKIEENIESVHLTKPETINKFNKDETVTLYEGDENAERGNWSGRFDFLLSMLGFSVGVGNVWRFSYLCYRNGGGVFLIPYMLTLVIVGIPMFFMEMNIAQFSSLGTFNCWDFAPLFKALGVGMVATCFITTIYYNMLLSYGLVYLVSSFTSYLPWTDCKNPWNTVGCSHHLPLVNCTAVDGTEFDNGTCYNVTSYNMTSYNVTSFLGLSNISTFEDTTGILRYSPSEEYFNKEILGISEGIEYFGDLQWKLVVGLLVAWAIVFLCLMKGIKTSGRVVYVTATFPYIVLTVLLVRGLLLEGSYDGVRFYITPRWEKLTDGKVWRDGVTQIFYSMGMGWGGIHALASYNKFHNNTLRDTLFSGLGTCITSIFSGFVVFAFLGAMAHSMGVDIDKVVTSGPGLAFVVYPEAVTYMPWPSLWSTLFFLMIVTIGIDTQFVMFETVITGVLDQIPSLRPRKTLVILGLCVIEFLLGLPFTSSAGIYLLQLIDNFLVWISLPIIIFLEAIAFGYIYGMDRFGKDIHLMLGRYPSLYFTVCIKYLLPLSIPFVLIYSFIDYSRFKYGDHYVYPVWAEVMGWVISSSPIFFIAMSTVHTIVITPGNTFRQKLKRLIKPTREWGPYLAKHRNLVDYVDGFVVDLNGGEKVPLSSI